MTKPETKIPIYTVLLGVVCLIPIIIWDWTANVTSGDVLSSFRQAVKIPLDSFKTAGSTTIELEVPRTNFPYNWGNQFFAIFWVTRTSGGGEIIHDFAILRMDVMVEVNGSTIIPGDATYPYGYSADSRNVGRKFSVKPGDNVKITVRANDQEALPSGDLVIEPDWPGHNKDAMVTLDLNESFHGILRVVAVVGLVLIVFGLLRIRKAALES